MKMTFFNTKISKRSIDLVNEVLQSNFISAGAKADEFERLLARDLGLINPVTLNSGTSALHLALAVAGVSNGDEVIIPAQTFIATGHAVLYQGAKPVFADIQYNTGNIDPESIEQKITTKTKAIIPVHWGGYPCDLDEINHVASKYNLAVIEDAAHAIGARYKDKPIGSVSRFTAFSFQAIKHLTTGDGGAVCCLDPNDLYNLKRRRWFDIDRENSMPDLLGERVYNSDQVGYKYHMNDIAASIGIGNLSDLDNILLRHRTIGATYRDELSQVPGLTLLEYKSDRLGSFWLFTILVNDRGNFIRLLKSEGIPASVVHQRIDKNQVFGGLNEDLVNQARFNENQVSIPVHSGLTDENVYDIIKTIKKGW